MHTINPDKSALVLVDFQTRLMPAINHAETRIENARRLLVAAETLGHPVTLTEQLPDKLGQTVDILNRPGALPKATFDSFGDAGIAAHLEGDADLIIAGCEAHVCVLQTVLGALDRGRRVFVAEDAIGSRSDANRLAAIERMRWSGAQIVTTEMVVFEWLTHAERPEFRPLSALIKQMID